MKKKILKLLVLGFTLVFTVAAENVAATAAAPAVPSMGAAVFRMVGSLAVVIALFFAGAWLFRNMHRFKAGQSNQRKLQVLEGKSIGPRQAIYVVAYEQQRLLIGSTAQGLTLLMHLPEGQTQTETSSERIVPVSFGEALMHALGRK
ncbi:MAG TPA: FliO/MopB family protein [Verrucomicrobiae bacterium]